MVVTVTFPLVGNKSGMTYNLCYENFKVKVIVELKKRDYVLSSLLIWSVSSFITKSMKDLIQVIKLTSTLKLSVKNGKK